VGQNPALLQSTQRARSFLQVFLCGLDGLCGEIYQLRSLQSCL